MRGNIWGRDEGPVSPCMPSRTAPTSTSLQDLAPRLLYDRKEAARQLSISIRSLDYFLAAGRFRTRRIGKKVLIPHTELVRD